MMDKSTHSTLEQLLGYRFRNPALLQEAFTHASIADNRLQSNERQEFFGDAILGMVVCEYLFHTYPDLLEGDLTKIKSAAVSRRACARIVRSLELDQFLLLGKGMSGKVSIPPSLAAAVFESVIAAIYLDGGLEEARKFILHHLIDYITQSANSGHQHNFKSLLQQYSQQHFGRPASYILLDENGPDHAKCFKVAVEIDSTRYSSCWAASKKQAEQDAALNALLELNIARIDEDTNEVVVAAAATAMTAAATATAINGTGEKSNESNGNDNGNCNDNGNDHGK